MNILGVFAKRKSLGFRKNMDILLQAFPSYLEGDVKSVLKFLNKNGDFDSKTGSPVGIDQRYEVLVDKEKLIVPYRIYFRVSDSAAIAKLDKKQQTILHCILSRSWYGSLRQLHLTELSGHDQEWVIPFKIQLLSEYVQEIHSEVIKQINEDNLDQFINFAKNNPKYMQLMINRSISYWNCYFSGSLDDSSAYKTLKKISS
jgi:hypothetical protein